MNRMLLVRKILDYIRLDSEVVDHKTIHETIEKDILFKGTNLWILAFAIILASVGLNMNAPAVIIGAMLISPLMGPIIGLGYSIATYNFTLFRKALKNFAFAVGASLIASTLYFSISPIYTAHSELLARTSPTIYDVLIALFGGLAGIVAISSKQKGNVIPGVAIATALMPPLCTAGFGLATGQFKYFFGAFYLFSINSVFIALASLIISQVLKFPIITLINNAQKRRINHWITLIIIVFLVPSIYFGYQLVQHEKFGEHASQFISSISSMNDNYLLKHEVIPEQKKIVLTFVGNSLSEKQKDDIRSKALDFSLPDADIVIQQGFTFENLSTKNIEMESLTRKVNQLTAQLQEKEKHLSLLTQNDSLGKPLLKEISALYPQVISLSYSVAQIYSSDESDASELKILIITSLPKKGIPIPDQRKINAWLKTRLETTNLKVYFSSSGSD